MATKKIEKIKKVVMITVPDEFDALLAKLAPGGIKVTRAAGVRAALDDFIKKHGK